MHLNSIHRRLTLAFTAVLALMILVLGLGLLEQHRMEKMVDHLNNTIAKAERDALLWKELLSAQGIDTSLLISTGDPAKQKPLRQQISAQLETIDQLARSYEPQASGGDADAALLREVIQAYGGYKKALNDVLSAVESGSSDFSRVEFNDKYVPQLLIYKKALGAWAQAQQAAMNAGVDSIKTSRPMHAG